MDPLGLPTTTTTMIHEGNFEVFAQKNTLQRSSSNLSLASHDIAKHWYFLYKPSYDEVKTPQSRMSE
jgi:hypothetical protein